jgi:hypothetical protein
MVFINCPRGAFLRAAAAANPEWRMRFDIQGATSLVVPVYPSWVRSKPGTVKRLSSRHQASGTYHRRHCSELYTLRALLHNSRGPASWGA